MSIRWIGQDDRKGCAIAVVAMIAGLTYSEAKQHFAQSQPDAGEREIDLYAAHEYLKQHGWEPHGYRSFRYNRETEQIEDFPLTPIEGAEVTWCPVLPSPVIAHAVLMLPDGMILDPARTEPVASLTEYPKV